VIPHTALSLYGSWDQNVMSHVMRCVLATSTQNEATTLVDCLVAGYEVLATKSGSFADMIYQF